MAIFARISARKRIRFRSKSVAPTFLSKVGSKTASDQSTRASWRRNRMAEVERADHSRVFVVERRRNHDGDAEQSPGRVDRAHVRSRRTESNRAGAHRWLNSGSSQCPRFWPSSGAGTTVKLRRTAA